MLVFSLLHRPSSSVITPPLKRSINILPPLLHLPSKLGPLYNCVLIAMWFYNLYYLLRTTSFIQLFQMTTSIKLSSHSRSTKRRYHKFSLHHLIFFIYLLINCRLVTAVHQNLLPISSLSIIPTAMLLPMLPQPSFSISGVTLCSVLSSAPTFIDSSSTDFEKLCYLSAWHTTMNNNSRLMNFSPGGNAICVDTGATCCISNNKADFIDFTSSHNKVLHGIGTGLSIEGSGTLQWCILDDLGNEIILPIHNCLYVPSAPMCLLSPQHMSQQTCFPDDGFHCKNIHGILTFAGHHRTIHYHHHNN